MQRPLFADWISAFAASLASAALAIIAYEFVVGDALAGGSTDLLTDVLRLTLLLFGPGAAVGAWIGVAVARHFGSTYPWRSGWVLGVLLGGVVLWALVR